MIPSPSRDLFQADWVLFEKFCIMVWSDFSLLVKKLFELFGGVHKINNRNFQNFHLNISIKILIIKTVTKDFSASHSLGMVQTYIYKFVPLSWVK
jgi:hypothetical protein